MAWIGCRRVGDVGRVDKSGEEYFFHALFDDYSPNGARGAHVKQAIGHSHDAGQPDLLHAVYSAMLSPLPVAKQHREGLNKRGLSDAEIEALGYKSTPLGDGERAALCEAALKAVRAAVGRDRLRDGMLSVPGIGCTEIRDNTAQLDEVERELLELRRGLYAAEDALGALTEDPNSSAEAILEAEFAVANERATLDRAAVRSLEAKYHAIEAIEAPLVKVVWRIPKHEGLLLPVRDHERRIVRLQIRLDTVAAGESRYRAWTSPTYLGSSGGRACHVSMMGSGDRVRAIEGVIKADITALRTGERAIGYSSANAWKQALDALEHVGCGEVVLPFDADVRTKKSVATAMARFSCELNRGRRPWSIETWDPQLGKGRDDVVAGKPDAEITRLQGGAAWTFLSDCIQSSKAPFNSEVAGRCLLGALPGRARLDPSAPFETNALEALESWTTEAEYQRLRAELKASGVSVRSLDRARVEARAARRKLVGESAAEDATDGSFKRGDQVEVAERLATQRAGIVFTEGQFFEYQPVLGIYRPLEEQVLSLDIQKMAGSKVGKRGKLSINAGFVTGALKLMSAQVGDATYFRNDNGVAFRNGQVSVHDGKVELGPHSQLNRCRFGYDFLYCESDSPKLRKACAAWFRDDDDAEQKETALLEHFGLSLLGQAPKFGRAVLYYGPLAGNGKSTLLAIIRGCIPTEYVSHVSPQDLGERFRLAEIAGKRANIMDDLPAKHMADAEQFKVAITGKNPLLAERKNQQPFSFVPNAGHFYGANGLVASDDPTDGFFRRWLVVTFNRVFSGTKDDVVDIEREILEERPQIVGMAIRAAAAALQRGSYTFPASHFVVMEQWRGGESVRAFVAECCETLESPEHAEPLGTLYWHYTSFAKDAGMRAVSKNNFSQRLFSIGLRKHTKHGNVLLLRTKAAKAQAEVEDSLAELLGGPADELTPDQWGSAFRSTKPHDSN